MYLILIIKIYFSPNPTLFILLPHFRAVPTFTPLKISGVGNVIFKILVSPVSGVTGGEVNEHIDTQLVPIRNLLILHIHLESMDIFLLFTSILILLLFFNIILIL